MYEVSKYHPDVVPGLEPLGHLALVLRAPMAYSGWSADIGDDQRVALVAGVFEHLVASLRAHGKASLNGPVSTTGSSIQAS